MKVSKNYLSQVVKVWPVETRPFCVVPTYSVFLEVKWQGLADSPVPAALDSPSPMPGASILPPALSPRIPLCVSRIAIPVSNQYKSVSLGVSSFGYSICIIQLIQNNISLITPVCILLTLE